MAGKTIVINHDKVPEALACETPGVLVAVSIVPPEINFKTWCYKMLIDAQTHELYYFEKVKYKEKADSWFSEKELARFEKRNARIDR